MTYRSLLDELLLLTDACSGTPWFNANASAFLQVCDAFGETARQHHDLLVDKYIARPADELDEGQLKGITASGPPLEVLLRSLKMLRDYRCAEPDTAGRSRHADIARLRAAIADSDADDGNAA